MNPPVPLYTSLSELNDLVPHMPAEWIERQVAIIRQHYKFRTQQGCWYVNPACAEMKSSYRIVRDKTSGKQVFPTPMKANLLTIEEFYGAFGIITDEDAA